MIHIIVINLIKIINCGKDYVMMCVCVYRSYIKFIIILSETYIYMFKMWVFHILTKTPVLKTTN